MIYDKWVNIIYPIEPEFNRRKLCGTDLKKGIQKVFAE